MQNSVKSMSEHAFTQFELVNYLLQNLYKWDLKPIEQLVLLQLAYHYNPTKRFVFPKQKTIAQKINVSERSVIRAIQSLVKAGLIMVECNLSNKYCFSPKLTAELAQNEKKFEQDKMSDGNDKNSSHNDKMSHPLIEQTNELINEPLQLEDYKILVSYAKEHKARNVNAYINALKQSGGAQQIIQQHKNITKRYDTGETKRIEKIMNEEIEPMPPEFFKNLRAKLVAQCS